MGMKIDLIGMILNTAGPQLPQRQDALIDQLRDLRDVANKLGLYDAADYLRVVLVLSAQEASCSVCILALSTGTYVCSRFILRVWTEAV